MIAALLIFGFWGVLVWLWAHPHWFAAKDAWHPDAREEYREDRPLDDY